VPMSRGQRPVQNRVHMVRNESHRAVGHEEVDAMSRIERSRCIVAESVRRIRWTPGTDGTYDRRQRVVQTQDDYSLLPGSFASNSGFTFRANSRAG
jgi:hypothetical protein